MNPPNTFEIDAEYTRALARDLDVASTFAAPSPTPLPDDAMVAGFVDILSQALSNLTARSEQLHADTAHIARSGFALADAAEATDNAASQAFQGFQVS
ncbi:hypothetical protein [Corynebacterium ammoniagenes]|uniref:Transducer protein Htr23 n=1 Tax=Corynebacterium ammoniagenes DSM 20306 TaxID=649754 RepID=A0ABN0ACJ1_CORAM|nr:hypothetical protein [Corynebacterium ammoniagenes]APT81957.1 transducer protein Htr23 [Corynebacterium ammoniagenes DSM 20306]AQS73073.1 transducer protein Htr23 [Corynebacterium ammoniagenes]EFG80514.1 hypothetical protein HMPREF0281_02608 [Corynebacterium ammoniagenes DSM 20306]